MIDTLLRLLEYWFELLLSLWPVSAVFGLALACGLAISNYQTKALVLKHWRHLMAPFFMPLKLIAGVVLLFGGLIPAMLLPDIRLELLVSVFLFHILWSAVLLIRYRGARSLMLVIGVSQLWLSLTVVGAVGSLLA